MPRLHDQAGSTSWLCVSSMFARSCKRRIILVLSTQFERRACSDRIQRKRKRQATPYYSTIRTDTLAFNEN